MKSSAPAGEDKEEERWIAVGHEEQQEIHEAQVSLSVPTDEDMECRRIKGCFLFITLILSMFFFGFRLFGRSSSS
jgi:hypothetical protein